MYVNLSAIVLTVLVTILKYFSTQIIAIIHSLFNWCCNNFTKSSLSNEKYAKLRAELIELKEAQSKVDQINHFAQHSLLQRKINKITDQVEIERKELRSSKLTQSAYIKVAYYVVLVLMCVLLTWSNRNEPIIAFSCGENIFYPFSFLMAFPSGVSNAIGVPVWLFIVNRLCDIVFNKVSLANRTTSDDKMVN